MSVGENRALLELSPSMDEKAIFLQLTRIWTTHGVGNSQSMDASAVIAIDPEAWREIPFTGSDGAGKLLKVETGHSPDDPGFADNRDSAPLSKSMHGVLSARLPGCRDQWGFERLRSSATR